MKHETGTTPAPIAMLIHGTARYVMDNSDPAKIAGSVEIKLMVLARPS